MDDQMPLGWGSNTKYKVESAKLEGGKAELGVGNPRAPPTLCMKHWFTRPNIIASVVSLKLCPTLSKEKQTILMRQENAIMNQLVLFVQRIINLRIS